MGHLSTKSEEILQTCHPDIIAVVHAAAIPDGPPFRVIAGHRGEAEQNALFHKGFTKLSWNKSRHNAEPSEAADLVPEPVQWRDHAPFHLLAGWVLAKAEALRISLRWGGDWNRNWNLTDQQFNDLCHFELVRVRKICSENTSEN